MKTPGAKNKPKTVAELTRLLAEAAKREGVDLDADDAVKELVQEATERVGAEKAVADAKAKLKKFADLEIELEPTEIDTFKCGACGETMANQMPKCPTCEADLNWQAL